MAQKPNPECMRLAIREAGKNVRRGSCGGPFGACIVKEGRVLTVARNAVLKNDASAHAEINAIRAACRKLKTFDLSGCTIYSTTEPCPMCFAAIHWARIRSVIYGTSISDVKKRGFNELDISCAEMKARGKSRVRIVAHFLKSECLRLLRDWDALPAKRVY
ncbi:MAG TPA: nucleoside deaminase [Patescibacteria group bacterium]|nr:nucleoside deaminase [Patescibacteria group bacterium]